MTVNGFPIQDYPFPPSPVKIEYSIDFEEHEARTFAGITPGEYAEMPGDPKWCTEDRPLSKAQVLAAYRLQKMIAAVRDHEMSKKVNRR